MVKISGNGCRPAPAADLRVFAAALRVGPVSAAAAGPGPSILEGDCGTLAPRLRSGRMDALSGALRAPPPLDDVVAQPLAADPFAVALAAGHPLAAGATARALAWLAEASGPTAPGTSA